MKLKTAKQFRDGKYFAALREEFPHLEEEITRAENEAAIKRNQIRN